MARHAANRDPLRIALTEAAHFTGERAGAIFEGGSAPRACAIAYAALGVAFPHRPRTGDALRLGYSSAHHAAATLRSQRGADWWREEWVDEIVGALVGPSYGVRAE